MSVSVIKSVQKLPITIEQAWDFFSNPNNLLVITPPSLQLKVTNEVFGDEVYAGQIISYRVKPLLNISFYWMTEIKHVEKYKMFVDEQRKGPYALWHHQHHFKKIDGGMEMTDIVHYKNPLSFLGSIANKLFVSKKVNEIFEYRKVKIESLFGKMQ